ncbi:MAG: DEAD/DEAH box helicase, partial [Myxococcota bacterium]
MAATPLGNRVTSGDPGSDEILSRFLDWVAETGLEPYPSQEDALLELMQDHHVVLGTPTGSGKSLVALGLHFKARCEGRRSFYTAPTKALANEKFFALCEDLGAEHVGMLTGDASINRDAPLLCCTAEVLANMALREGPALDAPYVVMDEFHYYGDRARGSAWQIPLLTLRDTLFLLMSATLGNPARIAERLERDTGRPVATVFSDQRPVPLDFDYRETPMQETVEALLEAQRAPLYIVHFTQRECAEQAQGLVSARIASGGQRREIARALEGVAFDTPYGRDVQRFLRAGVGIHHPPALEDDVLMPPGRGLTGAQNRHQLHVGTVGEGELGHVGDAVGVQATVVGREPHGCEGAGEGRHLRCAAAVGDLLPDDRARLSRRWAAGVYLCRLRAQRRPRRHRTRGY